MTREKGYAPTKGPKELPEWKHDSNIVPAEVKAVLKGVRAKQPKDVKKFKVEQGHKGYKNFVSWS